MQRNIKTDLCIYNGTSGGVTAAIAAARQVLSVMLVKRNVSLTKSKE